MDAGLAGSTALITGGGTGIGFALAAALAHEGADVILAGLDLDDGALDAIRESGRRAYWLEADISTERGVEDMLRTVRHDYGVPDLFVSNAAVARHEPVTRITAEAWAATLDTNLTACALACRSLAADFIQRGHGSILIIGSTAALIPTYRESAYRVSKAGLKALMEVMAIELAPFGIRVNLLTPGGFATRLTKSLPPAQTDGRVIPLGRLGHPAELGAACVLLLSDTLSPYTTGSEVIVDGGFHLRPMELYSPDALIALNASPTAAVRLGTSARD